jgi:hypothetical protein
MPSPPFPARPFPLPLQATQHVTQSVRRMAALSALSAAVGPKPPPPTSPQPPGTPPAPGPAPQPAPPQPAGWLALLLSPSPAAPAPCAAAPSPAAWLFSAVLLPALDSERLSWEALPAAAAAPARQAAAVRELRGALTAALAAALSPGAGQDGDEASPAAATEAAARASAAGAVAAAVLRFAAEGAERTTAAELAARALCDALALAFTRTGPAQPAAAALLALRSSSSSSSSSSAAAALLALRSQLRLAYGGEAGDDRGDDEAALLRGALLPLLSRRRQPPGPAASLQRVALTLAPWLLPPAGALAPALALLAAAHQAGALAGSSGTGVGAAPHVAGAAAGLPPLPEGFAVWLGARLLCGGDGHEGLEEGPGAAGSGEVAGGPDGSCAPLASWLAAQLQDPREVHQEEASPALAALAEAAPWLPGGVQRRLLAALRDALRAGWDGGAMQQGAALGWAAALLTAAARAQPPPEAAESAPAAQQAAWAAAVRRDVVAVAAPQLRSAWRRLAADGGAPGRYCRASWAAAAALVDELRSCAAAPGEAQPAAVAALSEAAAWLPDVTAALTRHAAAAAADSATCGPRLGLRAQVALLAAGGVAASAALALREAAARSAPAATPAGAPPSPAPAMWPVLAASLLEALVALEPGQPEPREDGRAASALLPDWLHGRWALAVGSLSLLAGGGEDGAAVGQGLRDRVFERCGRALRVCMCRVGTLSSTSGRPPTPPRPVLPGSPHPLPPTPYLPQRSGGPAGCGARGARAAAPAQRPGRHGALGSRRRRPRPRSPGRSRCCR